MNDQLDDALAALAREPSDDALGGLEAGVWAVVKRRDTGVPGGLRWAAVTAALGIGMVAGGVSGAVDRRPAEMAAFDVHASLAPSSLLGGT